MLRMGGVIVLLPSSGCESGVFCCKARVTLPSQSTTVPNTSNKYTSTPCSGPPLESRVIVLEMVRVTKERDEMVGLLMHEAMND